MKIVLRIVLRIYVNVSGPESLNVKLDPDAGGGTTGEQGARAKTKA